MTSIKVRLILIQMVVYMILVECRKPGYGFIKNGNDFEGDIKLDKYTAVLKKGRVSVIDRKFTWDYGIVPYAFDSSLSYYPYERQLITNAMGLIAKHSCVRFQPRTTENYYLRFIRGSGCYSYVGKSAVTGQPVSIGVGCGYIGIILHEIMHSLGFFHTSSRPDRDSYVYVFYNNILSAHINDFRKYTNSEVSRQGAPYDFKSILHLPKNYFSKNGKNTIESRAGSHVSLGQLNGLTPIDIQEINTLYRCAGRKGCYFALGMEDKTIPDSWISASSYQRYYQPHQARLHLQSNTQGSGVWCAEYSSSGQYLLIDLGKSKQVTGIATQGKSGIFTPDAWVESYSIRYSRYRFYTWYDVQQTFTGNWDDSSVHYNSINHPITARYVMIKALKWTQEICMRIELYGCDV